MSAREKLEEAQFFLEKLRASAQLLPQDLATQKESRYYLSAFEAAAVSVIDYLLEDCNDRFSLGILLSERNLRSAFEREVQKPSNEAASESFQWWKQRRGQLECDPIGQVMIGKRHIDIHRTLTRPDLAKIETGNGIVLSSGSLDKRVFRKGKPVEVLKSPEQPTQRPKATDATFNWFFSDYPDEPVIAVCEKFLDKLESFVSNAEDRLA